MLNIDATKPEPVLFDLSKPEMSCRIPDGTCLLAYRGSIAHNMYMPNSDPQSIDDVDLMGIVLAPENHYIGLTDWGSRGTKEYKEGKYDCVFYEIRKAFGLLLHGNPNILSLLWIEPRHFLFKSAAGKRIVDNRSLFAGKHVYASFAGYASAQLQKMETRDPAELREYIAVTHELKYRGAHPNHKGEKFERPSDPPSGEAKDAAEWDTDRLLARLRHYQKKGENIGYLGDKRKELVLEHGYDSKNAAHCIRLLRMCNGFLKTGEMEVYRQDGAELLEIKRGMWPLDRVKAHAEDLFAEVKASRDSSPLPDEPDRPGSERLLATILSEHLSLSI